MKSKTARGKAYQDGYRNGRIDRWLGRRSDYAWFSVIDNNPYCRDYGEGYQMGWLFGLDRP